MPPGGAGARPGKRIGKGSPGKVPGGLVAGAAILAVTLLQHVVLLLFLCQCQAMEENFDRPIPRDDLLFTVEMALRKASRLWPKKRVPGDHDRLKPAAAAVVAHLELCGVRCDGLPQVHCVVAKLAQRSSGNQMTLDVEGVVDGSVGREKPLR